MVNFYGVLNLALLKQIKKCIAVKGERKKRNLRINVKREDALRKKYLYIGYFLIIAHAS